MKTRIWIIRLLSFVCITVAFAESAPTSFAGAGEPRITYSEMRTRGRPSEFYKLDYSADDQVCRGALENLNRPMTMPPNLKVPHDYAKIDTAFFLGTGANVSWEPRWLVFADKAGRAGILDSASVEIFNNGQQLRLFRFELGIGRGVVKFDLCRTCVRVAEASGRIRRSRRRASRGDALGTALRVETV